MSRTDDVVDGIRHMIIDDVLPAGSRLPAEKDLATALGVSRNSLREGVSALSILGVLEVRQGDGTYVTSLAPAVLLASLGFVVGLSDPASTSSFHRVRRLLETEAAGLAAGRIDAVGLARAGSTLRQAELLIGSAPVDRERLMMSYDAFHQGIHAACGEPVLAALLDALSSRQLRVGLGRNPVDLGVAARVHGEHRAILRALELGDADGVRIRMAAHLLDTLDDVAQSQWPDSSRARSAVQMPSALP